MNTLDRLPASARLALPHVSPFPGTCWTVIVGDTPRNSRGHSRNYIHCIQPLIDAGLVGVHYRELPGNRRERLHYLTTPDMSDMETR